MTKFKKKIGLLSLGLFIALGIGVAGARPVINASAAAVDGTATNGVVDLTAPITVGAATHWTTTFTIKGTAPNQYFENGSVVGTYYNLKFYNATKPFTGSPVNSITYSVNIGGGTNKTGLSARVSLLDSAGAIIVASTQTPTFDVVATGVVNNFIFTSSDVANSYGAIFEFSKISGWNMRLRRGEVKYNSGSFDPITDFTVTTNTLNLSRGQAVSAGATILPAGANQVVNWVSANTGIATVNASGIITAVAVGSTTVTGTTLGTNGSGSTLSQVITVNVTQATITITEAKAIAPNNGIIYHASGVITSINATYDREFTIRDLVNTLDTILVFQYGINPLNSYKYIPTGEITIEATVGVYNTVNQFANVTVLTYTDGAEEFATWILAEDVLGQCSSKWTEAKARVTALNSDELAKLQNGTATNIVAAQARYEAWAAAIGDMTPYSATMSGTQLTQQSPISDVLIVVIFGFTLLGAYFVMTKRKQNS